MINIIGTLKKVDTKSKVGDDQRTYHNITIGIEITDGVEKVQEIIESLKQLTKISIENVQPTLTAPRSYGEGEEKAAE